MGLMDDLAVRQCLLEFLNSFVGDLGVAEVQPLETGQPSQLLQAGIGDLSVVEMQKTKVGGVFQVH